MVLLSQVAWMREPQEGGEPRGGSLGSPVASATSPHPVLPAGAARQSKHRAPCHCKEAGGFLALITSAFFKTFPPTKLLTETFRALGAWLWGSMGLVRPVDASLDIRLAFTLRSPLLVSLFPPVILRILALPS